MGKSLGEENTFTVDEIKTTSDIVIPHEPLDRVIGQDDAIELANIAAVQRRHFILVGPPGTGKSMIAQALSLHLPRPLEEIRIVHNPENPERPSVEVRKKDMVDKDLKEFEGVEGELIDPKEAPVNVAERLGYKCIHCGTFSSYKERVCPKCTKTKTHAQQQTPSSPFSDILGELFEVTLGQQLGARDRVTTTRNQFGKEEVVVFERSGEMIKVLDQKALEKRRELEKISPRKVLVPVDRNPFVLATGASETELLGDVRHDPYGGHHQLGTPSYERVVPGVIHEAHEGVLFIDELPHLGHLQRFILTAMQEKRFPIIGRNPQSSGASVRVDNVPCDFIFVGACNIQDMPYLLSPLRSRINGSGYEILLNTTMEDNEPNRAKLVQFVAQEITMDKKIPHATKEAVTDIIEEAKRRARDIDKQEKSLTLRLRDLGGLVRAAGDLVVTEGDEIIEARHIKRALERSKTVEEQIKEKYGSYYTGISAEMSEAQKSVQPNYYWNYHQLDEKRGYE